MQNKKILLVDDSPVSITMSKMIIKQHHYKPLIAYDGEEAIEVALAERPDLILLDVVMPKLDGLETLKRIRDMDEIKHIPIIMVTTRSEAENMEKGFKYGCNDYITKPFKSAELVSKIEKILN